MTAQEIKEKVITTEEEARDIAIEWQMTFDDAPKSWGELYEEQVELIALAEKFNLMEEFQENGIL